MKRWNIGVLVLVAALWLSFTAGDYFAITKQDVDLQVPKGFPKPSYDFKGNKLRPEVFVLGRRLFYDPILSRDYSTSCATCHQRIAAFAHTDHALSHGIYASIGKRNVPALQNLIWKDAFMMDGGVNSLEVQPLSPITNHLEMDEDLPHLLAKLQADTSYPESFRQAFGDTVITSKRMLQALTQFIGLMVTADSKYDKYTRGEAALSEQELSGLKLFRQHCADCHKEPLFTDNTYRSIGLAPDTLLNDSGRIIISGKAEDCYRFKVPSLRNIEMTSPYMHDGRFRTLRQVMDHYGNGAFYEGYDKAIDKNIGLNDAEKKDIIAFLKTLTDKTFLYDRRFADPNYR